MTRTCRKAQASILAVEERQALEKLTRDEKTASRTFSQLRDRQEEFEQKRASLREDGLTYEAKKANVCVPITAYTLDDDRFFQLEETVKENSEQLGKVKQQLEERQSERNRIKYEATTLLALRAFLTLICSRLEADLNGRLMEVHQKLMQAGFDQKETEREAKLKETLANLQRIFPGTHASTPSSSCANMRLNQACVAG